MSWRSQVPVMPSLNTDQPTPVRQVTGVAQLIADIGNRLARAYPSYLWVKGEVSAYRNPAGGHHYFNLVEQREGNDPALLPCAIWKNTWPTIQRKLAAAEMSLSDGQEILVQGRLRLYDVRGSLTFHVTDIFPEYTLGQVEANRRAVLNRIRAEGLLGQNGRHELAAVPLRIGLISSGTAAGREDFLQAISLSGFAFEVYTVDVPMQGREMEAAVCRALESLTRAHRRLELDAICIVRGGGSPTDLTWWDSYAICVAVARAPVPVISGIGHERDRLCVEEVAHTRTSTPTAAAQLVCRTVKESHDELCRIQADVSRLSQSRVDGLRLDLMARGQLVARYAAERLSSQKQLVPRRRAELLTKVQQALQPHRTTIAVLSASLRRDARQAIDVASSAIVQRKSGLCDAAHSRIVARFNALSGRVDRLISQSVTIAEAALRTVQVLSANCNAACRSSIRACSTQLQHYRALIQALDPMNTLRRGYTLTMGPDGKALRSAACLQSGQIIVTRTADGEVVSQVTQVTSGGPVDAG
ncbi:MAG: exodeoxyribonuclease VII large subunit [Gemmataceae bacterium]